MKKRTKLLSLLMCLVMLVSMLPLTAYAAEEDIAPVTIDTAESVEDSIPVTVDAAASDTLQDADGDGYYDIGTADALYAFAELVNGGETSANAILTADIVVNEGTMTADSTDARTWTPIGNTSNKYTGIFDGNGKTISGLYFNDSSNSEKNKYVGLFGYVSGGEIKNVGVINSWINAYDFVGGVVGRADTNSKVTDCYNTGTVSGSGGYVGGVAGYNYSYVTLTNCYNTGTVRGGSNVGGVAGNNYSYVTLTNCHNTGTVRGNGKHVGGVAGQISENCTVTSCYNTGTVSGGNKVGGVVGLNENVTMTNCYNTGTVSGYGERVGGVVGDNYYTALTDCYNTGTVSGSDEVGGVVGRNELKKLTNCYNIGAVKANQYVGGVVGRKESGSVNNSYYLAGCAKDGRNIVQNGIGNKYAGSTTADANGSTIACADFSTGEVAFKLGSSFGQDIDNGKTVQTSPSFTGAKVYSVVGCDGSTTVYSNTENNTDAHVYVSGGFCACGVDYQPAKFNGDAYEISNAGQLYWFMEKVNGGETSANAILINHIVVNEGTMTADSTDARAWTPIGYANNYYAGTFDGCGFTVSGLYFNNSGTTDVGLFGAVSGGTVKNVGVLDSYLGGKWYVGGVVGYIDKGTVEGCYNSGTVSGVADVGGVVGWANTDSTVINCYNTGNVSGSGDYVGGVVGNIANGTVEGCYNSGTVSGSGDYVGGVAGRFEISNMTNCYNTGNVTGSNYVGGVAGNNEGDSFTELCTVTNCYNSGTVSGSGNYVGGVTGYKNTYGFVTNCYYLADSETDSIDTTTFKTAEQFAGGEVAYLLNGDQSTIVFKQTIGTDTSPNFTGGTVYQVMDCKDEVAYSNTNENIGHNWVGGTCTVCEEVCSHSGGKATCTTQAVCEACSMSYGEVDKTNHDETVAYENGFCPICDAYEPATDSNADGIYEISNAGQLYWFAQQVNSGNSAINGILTANITVNTNVLSAEGTLNGDGSGFRTWSPIGTDITTPYSGTFDGNGKTISGLYFSNTNKPNVGLFGYVGGSVQNVGVIDSYFKGNKHVGGVVGYNHSDSTVTNCYSTGTVSGTSEVGGVAGYNNGTVTNCYSTGTGNAGSNVGGVVGSNYGTVTDCYNTATISGNGGVGGVVGRNYGTVTDCYNTGTVSVSNGTYIGGVVGCNESGSTVTNCYNTGAVSGIGNVGGVVGRNYGTVTDCYNNGTVSGVYTFVGGVAGSNQSGGTVSNCYNTGDVNGITGDTQNVGSVVGSNSGTVTNCYYPADSETDELDGTTAKTAEQFKSGEVAYLLNGDQSTIVFKQTLGENGDTSPNFTGGTVYQVTVCVVNTAYSNTNENIGHNWVGGTCTICATACSHSYEANKCSVCGTAQITYCGTNTTLGTALDLNFAFSLCDVDENAYAVITGSSAEKTQTIPKAEWTLSEDGNYYLLSYKGLAAKEMCDTVSLVIYDGNGNAMKIYNKEGAEITCSDSIQSYALRCIGSNDEAYTPVVKTLLREMLDYGSEAQLQFTYNTDKLANGDTYNTYNGSDVSDEGCTPVGGKYMGTSLILENRIEMQMGFTGIAGIQSAAVSYTDHYGEAKSYSGENVSIEEYEDANGNVVAYGVVIPHIVVADARQMITVTVTTDDETIVVKDSIAGYVARHNSEGVYGAIMDFSDAALAYFAAQK